MKKLVSLLLAVCMCLAIGTLLIGCGDNAQNQGTYYLFDDGETDKSSWVKIEGSKWSDSDGMSGTFELDGENISFYVEWEGEKELLLDGTLKDGKLTIGDSIASVVYYLENTAPDSSNNGDDDTQSENNGSNYGDDTQLENNGNGGGENNNNSNKEELLADFTYEKEGDKYIITGVKNENSKSLTVPDFVSEIKDSAFVNCTELEHITVPFVGTSKDYNAGEIAEFAVIFKGETAEDDTSGGSGGGIHRPADIVGNYYRASYSYVSELKSITVTGDVLSSVYIGAPLLESVEFKASVYGIAKDSFYNCQLLKKAVLGTSVQLIEARAFSECYSLEELEIESGLVSIGDGAFTYCQNLKNIELPATLTSIGATAFNGCRSLTSITLPASLTSIGNSAFIGCDMITSIIIPANVSSLGERVFCNMDNLTSLIVEDGNTAYATQGNCLIDIHTKTLLIGLDNSVIPTDGSVTSIADNAFAGRSGLTEIVIPHGVTVIRWQTFAYCTSLKSVVIPNTVTVIENDAFNSCSALESIIIPDSVIEISSDILKGCTNLKSLTAPFIGANVSDYDSAYLGYFFDYNDEADNESVPQSLLEVTITCDDVIAEDAFYGCNGIEKIIIGGNVTKIDNAAFLGCSKLTVLTLPQSISKIGRNVFRNCEALAEINYNGSSSEWSAISKGFGWDDDTGDYTVICNDGNVAKN